LNAANDTWEALPAALRGTVEAQLAPDEKPLVWLDFDLDSRLHYARGLLVLTDRRLLEIGPTEAVTSTSVPRGTQPGLPFRAWPLTAVKSLRAKEHAGLGVLELLGAESLLGQCRYTIGRAAQAHGLVDRFDRPRRGDRAGGDEPAESPTTVCPSCGAILAADQAKCPDCGLVKDKPALSSLYRLIGFAKSSQWLLLLGFALMVASTGADLVPTCLTKPLLDNVLVPAYEHPERGSFSAVQWYLLGFAGFALLTWLLSWARTYVLALVSERIAVDLRNRTYRHMQCLSLEFFGGKRTGDLISRISTDTDRICYFLSVYVLDFGNDVLNIVFTATILVYQDWLLALATLVPLPIIGYLIHRVRNRLRRGFALGTRAWGEMTSVLADTIPGIRVVKAFAQERREVERFQAANDRVFQANCRVNTLWSFFGPAVGLLTQVGVLSVWAFGAWRVFHHDITVGALWLFVLLTNRFYSRMDSMSRMVSAVQRAGASAQRIFAILDRVPSVAEPVRPVQPGRLRGEVEFRDVAFHYGSRPVLRDVNLKVRPGEMIGLVGPSGAGKTTMVNLVCRFYDVAQGAILVDGVDIRSFPLEQYRRHIGIVLQEPFLFYGTIAENIAYGRPDASRAEIIAAARAARAHEFILRLPDRYDSLVGERGQFLSGGERQRISIARALLIDPRILILDEATSSVDTETEREIQLALENLIQGRTTIAIAHRLSTLRRADRLVIVERGRITEVGPHSQLLERQGTYARLYRAQFEMSQGKGI
jgi:ATP-binding cassette subfamily B protein